MVLKTQYFYQGSHPSVVMSTRGKFVFVRSGPLPLAELRHDETLNRTLLLACDGNHSVLDRADHTGHPLEPCRYTTYGHDNNALSTRLGFNGELQSLQENLYLLGNGTRIYSPSLMRFYSPDSFSPFDAGGFNAYLYCDNDPVNYTDPSGHMMSPSPPSRMNTPDIDLSGSPIGAPQSPPSWDADLFVLQSPAAIATSPVPSPAVSSTPVTSPSAQTARQSPAPATSSALHQPPGAESRVTLLNNVKPIYTTAQAQRFLSWNNTLKKSYKGLGTDRASRINRSRSARELVINSRTEGQPGREKWESLDFEVPDSIRRNIRKALWRKGKTLLKPNESQAPQ
jgi:RHS repeat-associated protein